MVLRIGSKVKVNPVIEGKDKTTTLKTKGKSGYKWPPSQHKKFRRTNALKKLAREQSHTSNGISGLAPGRLINEVKDELYASLRAHKIAEFNTQQLKILMSVAKD